MSSWKKIVNASIHELENRWDEIRLKLSARLGLTDEIQIVPYRSYGNRNRIYISGRVLEDKKIASAGESDTILDNLLNIYKRFESDEIPGCSIEATLPGEKVLTIGNNEGYFHFNHHLETPIIADELWHKIPLRLLSAPVSFEKEIMAIAEVMIPPLDAEFGISSDIDDTIVKTGATNLLAMGKTVLLHNARTRLPFAGVSEFYKALQLGRNGKRNNPFFYVSSSPWNLYDLLVDYLDLNQIPAGPILLRDIGVGGESSLSDGHMGHKIKEITQVMEAYPTLPFVLIGDSGQEDPVIYQEVVRKFPGRILAIYIRDVQLADREKIAVGVSESLKNDKVEMMIVDNSSIAASHAANIGLIYQAAIPAIEQDKKEDKGQAAGKYEATIV
jgi:phosphatidate phosphatase APP1